MRLRVVSARNEIPNLNPNEKTVHLAFRASNVDFLNLMQRCPPTEDDSGTTFLQEDNVQCNPGVPGHARH